MNAAPISKRVGAYLIDLAVVLGCLLLAVVPIAVLGKVHYLLGIFPGTMFAFAGVFLLFVNEVGAPAYDGLSIGRERQGIRVVDAKSGAPIGLWRAVVRWAFSEFGWTAFFLPGRRGIHDLLAGSLVVDSASTASPKRELVRMETPTGHAVGVLPASDN